MNLVTRKVLRINASYSLCIGYVLWYSGVGCLSIDLLPSEYRNSYYLYLKCGKFNTQLVIQVWVRVKKRHYRMLMCPSTHWKQKNFVSRGQVVLGLPVQAEGKVSRRCYISPSAHTGWLISDQLHCGQQTCSTR